MTADSAGVGIGAAQPDVRCGVYAYKVAPIGVGEQGAARSTPARIRLVFVRGRRPRLPIYWLICIK